MDKTTIVMALLIPHKPEPEAAEPVEKKCIGVEKIEVGEIIKLPEPIYKSNISVEEALSKRRSIAKSKGMLIF
jgi:hypothetical protein